MQSTPQKSYKFEVFLFLALVPPILMVPASMLAAFAMVFAIPGNATPVQGEGFSRIWNTFMLYPPLAAPPALWLAWRSLCKQTINRKRAKVILAIVYAIFIGTWIRLIHGWIQYTS